LVDKNNITARYQNGVLSVIMPKSKRNSITIEVK